MLVLGILLILLAGGAIVVALFGGTGQSTVFDLGAFEVQTNALGAFLFGAVTVVVLAVGIGLIRGGAGRARRRRQEHRELKRLKKQEVHGEPAATSDSPTTTDPGPTSSPRQTPPS